MAQAQNIDKAQHAEWIAKHIDAMTLSEIAQLVAEDWPAARAAGTPSAFGNIGQHPANPYLQAMHTLNNTSENYGLDTGDSIVRYFLTNATGWRGDVAKVIKAELRKRIG